MGPSTRISSSENWRQAWGAVDNFNQSRNAYILIGDRSLHMLDQGAKDALARLPWALVIDFDHTGDAASLLTAAKQEHSKFRGFHHLLPGQTGTEVNFNAAVAWLMADGWDQITDSIPSSIADWRRGILEHLRGLATKLRKQVSPRPITVVVLGKDIEPAKLRGVFSAISEKIDNIRVVALKNDLNDQAGQTLKEEGANTEIYDCRYQEFAIGILEMIGDAPAVNCIRIPAKSDDSEKRTTIEIDAEKNSLFSECFELVHDGLAGSEGRENLSSLSFSEGAEVSWQDLSRNFDVERDLTVEMRQQIATLLDDNRAVGVTLLHKPGAGASTIVRRLAWDFHNLYPTILVNSYNNLTADYIEFIYQKSYLPLLIIVERANLLSGERERFFNELRSKQIRFVLLDVIRSTKFRTGGLSHFLDDQMVSREAERFCLTYSQWCAESQRADIRKLTDEEGLRDFRSPFFYNLYAFEKSISSIRDYVAAYVGELSKERKDLIAFLALIGTYSQHWLPTSSLEILAKKRLGETQHVSEILGDSARKLLLFDGVKIKTVHPLIAKEILKMYLSESSPAQEDKWRHGLTDFCVSFLDRIAHDAHRGSEPIESILTDLFVSRTETGGHMERAEFSELVLEIPTDQGRRRAFEQLCARFPTNPHYWNHLGRLINFRDLDTHEVAAECYHKAISLNPGDSSHHHGLGMVYRSAVRDLMWPYLVESETLLQRLQSTTPIFEKAEEAFNRARELSNTDEYARISHVQMIVRAIEDLLKRSNFDTYQQLLEKKDGVANWCIRQLTIAQNLMIEVEHLNAERESNRVTVEAAGRIDELLGNFETMVRGLTDLLNVEGVTQSPVRRSLARCYLRQVKGNLSELKPKNARRIVELLRENLRENPRDRFDLQMWFQAFRLLPEFTIDEAVERFSAWADESDAIDAWYYLYILHFLNVRRGVRASIDETRKYIERCRRNAPELISKRSFEWVAASSLDRPCPLLHHSELGAWKPSEDLFMHSERLEPMVGTIVEITRGSSGKIDVGGLTAFFAPGRGGFSRASDINSMVTFYLGFSYEGLRAWNVQAKLDN